MRKPVLFLLGAVVFFGAAAYQAGIGAQEEIVGASLRPVQIEVETLR